MRDTCSDCSRRAFTVTRSPTEMPAITKSSERMTKREILESRICLPATVRRAALPPVRLLTGGKR